MADGGMLDPPACLDVCALYGRSNSALVAGLLGSLGELDGGAAGVRLAEGLEKSGLTAARALAEVHAKVRERDAAPCRLGGRAVGVVGEYVVDRWICRVECVRAGGRAPACCTLHTRRLLRPLFVC